MLFPFEPMCPTGCLWVFGPQWIGSFTFPVEEEADVNDDDDDNACSLPSQLQADELAEIPSNR